MELDERPNGHAQSPPPADMEPAREPQRYVLTPQERALFEQCAQAMTKLRASMYSEAESLKSLEASVQTALQLLVTQQGLKSPKGFRLENDCAALVEQF